MEFAERSMDVISSVPKGRQWLGFQRVRSGGRKREWAMHAFKDCLCRILNYMPRPSLSLDMVDPNFTDY